MKPKAPHPLFKPATRANEKGMFAMRVLNDLKAGRKPAPFAIKGAGLRVPAPKRKGA
jgi:hypothetical protein